jgi:hypothetical protein
MRNSALYGLGQERTLAAQVSLVKAAELALAGHKLDDISNTARRPRVYRRTVNISLAGLHFKDAAPAVARSGSCANSLSDANGRKQEQQSWSLVQPPGH